MEKILLLAFVLYIAQCFFVYMQMNHFKATVRKLMDKGHVGIGVKKRKLSSGNVVVLVTDDSGQIIEAKQMKGVTLLARFKNIAKWEGKNYMELKQEALKEKKKNQALLQALTSLEEKLSVA
ncbi:transcriptional regulator GutM [Pectinatus cerevisiiphilus]|uniref:Glucitol operon activator protein GutM n=1 Tax=Pectinatus cerevisiiphilus TaxID=86956 RepID=A0A4R3KAG8_9FIRM|nr:transcriptional regulator GutM [Pectinatus cerevisiiphilus]TCS79955.1 glucitol operon activator protein GutM [Pectinatus cerevisiiphilus]